MSGRNLTVTAVTDSRRTDAENVATVCAAITAQCDMHDVELVQSCVAVITGIAALGAREMGCSPGTFLEAVLEQAIEGASIDCVRRVQL